jgi:hypothetical protein
MRVLLTIAALVFGSALSAQTSAPSPQTSQHQVDQSKGDNQTTVNHQQPTRNPSTVIKSDGARETQNESHATTDERDERVAYDRELISFTRSYVRATWVLVIVGGITMVAYGVQCGLLFFTLKHARISSERGLRAYVVVKDFTQDHLGPRVGTRYDVKVVWENTGQTPAVDVHTFMRIAILANEPTEFKEMEILAENVAGSGILGAGTEGTTALFLRSNVSAEERAEINMGRKKLFIYGVYIYKDIFKKRHITRMSHYFDPAIGLFNNSGTGNSIE